MAELILKPSYKQHLAYEALRNPDVNAVFMGGGAGGGKSWLICESRLVNCYRYPGYKSYIGREELKRLMQSTFLTWVKVCAWHNIPQEDWHVNGQYNYIEFKNGSRIDLLDLKFLPTDPLYERFGSLEYTDGAIEEAGEVEFLAYDVLKSRVGRHMNKELGVHPTTLITGNPKKNWTYTEFYKPWKAGTLSKDCVFIQSLYTDNAWTAEEYGKQLSQIKDKSTKERLMFGNWEYDDDPNALIEYDAIVDLFTNSVEQGQPKYMTVDVARLGQDKTVVYLWQGLEVYDIHIWEKQTLDVTAQKIKDLLFSEKIPYSHVIIDEDGVGGGVVDGLKGVKGFVANSTALQNKSSHQPDNYKNLKAQCYFTLADYINGHRIAVTTQDMAFRDLLIADLEQVKAKDMDKDGKRQIMPKDEVKELLGRSPDYSDALMMRMYFELKPGAGQQASHFIPSQTVRMSIPQMPDRPIAKQAHTFIPKR